MPELMVGTSTAQWQALVTEAEAACRCSLGEEMQSYLVFLLMRFARRTEVAASVLALEYLNGVLSSGRQRLDQLQEVGDKCLLYSGLFPHRAERRRVKISYYVDLGRSAFSQLAANGRVAPQYALYQNVADTFVPMMDVLQAMRTQGGAVAVLTPLQALELWQDTGSMRALDELRQATSGTPVCAANMRH